MISYDPFPSFACVKLCFVDWTQNFMFLLPRIKFKLHQFDRRVEEVKRAKTKRNIYPWETVYNKKENNANKWKRTIC